MRRSLQVFMTREDERELSDALIKVHPSMKVFDDQLWPTEEPQIVERIDLAVSRLAYLFPGDLFGNFEIPTTRRANGQFSGPASGCVVQLSRCFIDNGRLLSGSIGTGWSENHPVYSRMEGFWKDVAKAVKRMAENKLITLYEVTLKPAGTDNMYWCFSNAAKWVAAEPGRVLKDRATQSFFQLPESGEIGRKRKSLESTEDCGNKKSRHVRSRTAPR